MVDDLLGEKINNNKKKKTKKQTNRQPSQKSVK